MAYELSFAKKLPKLDRERYINDCCIGGDLVTELLLPAVRARYTDIQSEQEDWGWFIWFKAGSVALAIDVFTDDAEAGEFRVRLTSRIRTLLWSRKEQDTPELEAMRALVESQLKSWTGNAPVVARV
jgi:hypothetical protein